MTTYRPEALVFKDVEIGGQSVTMLSANSLYIALAAQVDVSNFRYKCRVGYGFKENVDYVKTSKPADVFLTLRAVRVFLEYRASRDCVLTAIQAYEKSQQPAVQEAAVTENTTDTESIEAQETAADTAAEPVLEQVPEQEAEPAATEATAGEQALIDGILDIRKMENGKLYVNATPVWRAFGYVNNSGSLWYMFANGAKYEDALVRLHTPGKATHYFIDVSLAVHLFKRCTKADQGLLAAVLAALVSAAEAHGQSLEEPAIISKENTRANRRRDLQDARKAAATYKADAERYLEVLQSTQDILSAELRDVNLKNEELAAKVSELTGKNDDLVAENQTLSLDASRLQGEVSGYVHRMNEYNLRSAFYRAMHRV